MDETALFTVHKPSKIIAQKGQHTKSLQSQLQKMDLTTTCVWVMNE